MAIRNRYSPSAAVVAQAAAVAGAGKRGEYEDALALRMAELQQRREMQLADLAGRERSQVLGSQLQGARDVQRAQMGAVENQQRFGQQALLGQQQAGLTFARDQLQQQSELAQGEQRFGQQSLLNEQRGGMEEDAAWQEFVMEQKAQGKDFAPHQQANLDKLDLNEQTIRQRIASREISPSVGMQALAQIGRERRAVLPTQHVGTPEERKQQREQDIDENVVVRPEGIYITQPDGTRDFKPHAKDDTAEQRKKFIAQETFKLYNEARKDWAAQHGGTSNPPPKPRMADFFVEAIEVADALEDPEAFMAQQKEAAEQRRAGKQKQVVKAYSHAGPRFAQERLGIVVPPGVDEPAYIRQEMERKLESGELVMHEGGIDLNPEMQAGTEPGMEQPMEPDVAEPVAEPPVEPPAPPVVNMMPPKEREKVVKHWDNHPLAKDERVGALIAARNEMLTQPQSDDTESILAALDIVLEQYRKRQEPKPGDELASMRWAVTLLRNNGIEPAPRPEPVTLEEAETRYKVSPSGMQGRMY
jgi:hypothetical protein